MGDEVGVAVNLLSLDPGNVTGWAFFFNNKLRMAHAAKKESFWSKKSWPTCVDSSTIEAFHLSTVLIEVPRWYPHDHSDVNDLLDLSVFVGELKRSYEAQGYQAELVWPRTWKGNVPKKITNNRTLAALTPDEVALLPRRPRAKDFDNNMLDAIGLGLWKLGRLR